MKIDYVIMASDSNPLYLDFWPLVSQIWQEEFSITPVLCYVGDDSSTINERYGEVNNFAPIDDVPVPFQAQWARFWQAQQYQEEVAIVSDIDMLPLSKYYFVEQIESIHEDKYVHLNPCIDSHGHLPACYHVAKGRLFRQVLGLDTSWEDSCRFVYRQNLGQTLSLPHLKEKEIYWFADELYTHTRIFAYHDQKVFCFLPRVGGQNGRRVDRPCWFYDVALLQKGYYFDAHCPRPYEKRKHLIDPLLKRKPLPYLWRSKGFVQYLVRNCIEFFARHCRIIWDRLLRGTRYARKAEVIWKS